MAWTGWIALAVALLSAQGAAAAGAKVQPPPVVLDLGPVVPTPPPTPRGGQRKRLITTITVQNKAGGESVVSFEASDVADEGQGRLRTLASKNYSLADEKPELNALRQKVLQQVRELERTLLEFAERAGPPKERAPIGAGGSGSGQPYR